MEDKKNPSNVSHKIGYLGHNMNDMWWEVIPLIHYLNLLFKGVKYIELLSMYFISGH